MQNKVTGALNPDSMQKIADCLSNIHAEMPFLIKLTPAEAKRIMRMEAARADFVRNAIFLAKQNEHLRPQFADVDEMEKDNNLCHQLDSIMAGLGNLLQLISDTRDQAGHEAYEGAREIYNTTKRAWAKGVPGSQMAYEELRKMFEVKSRPTKTNEG